MIEIIQDTLIDALKIFPFLFIAFLILELVEHKLSHKSQKLIKNSGKLGPIIGSLLGAFPQCGFGAAATNLYAARIISIGTLVSVYLSTSDEMLPILISEGTNAFTIFKIILLKVIIGLITGFIVDYFSRKREAKNEIHEFCEHEHCHCEEHLFMSSLKHALNILLYIVLVSFALNTVIYYLGEDKISSLFLSNTILGPFISSLIGLIPNCASSVVITELYLQNAITFGSMMAGLLTASGVGIMVLFKVNKNIKENLLIVSIIYFAGVISGILLDLFKIVI